MKDPRDWGKITVQMIIEEGGNSLLQEFGSLIKLLEKTFPGNDL